MRVHSRRVTSRPRQSRTANRPSSLRAYRPSPPYSAARGRSRESSRQPSECSPPDPAAVSSACGRTARSQSLVSIAESVDCLHAVAVEELDDDSADHVVKTRTEPTASHNAGGESRGLEEYLLTRSGAF